MTVHLDPPAERSHGLVVHSRLPLNAEAPEVLLCRSPRTPTSAFFVRSHGDIPVIDPGTYRLSVDGGVRRPLSLSVDELRDRFPEATVEATLACAGNRRSEIRPAAVGIPWGAGAIGTAEWTGVRLADVLAATGVRRGMAHVAFTGGDDCDGERFAGSVPLDKASSPEVLLASAMNGAPLTAEHGAPLRVVVPGWIGARSVKWLRSVTVQREPSDSFFQREDYTIDDAELDELPVTSAVCRPDGDRGAVVVEGGTARLEGYAMGRAGRPVVRVELSCDGGRSWAAARLRGAARPLTWRLWRADVEVPPGATEIVVRAVDSSGASQPEQVAWVRNPRGYLFNAWPRVRVVGAPSG